MSQSGDKSITQLSIDECLKLLDFAKGKLAEEEAEDERSRALGQEQPTQDQVLLALGVEDEHIRQIIQKE